MADASIPFTGKPDILLMLQEGLPAEIETEARSGLDHPNLNFAVMRTPGGPYAGVELYLPSAIALFVTASFFGGALQEAGKDAYAMLKATAISLWKRAAGLNVRPMGSSGKVSSSQRYSFAFSITSEVSPGLSFKLLIQTETDVADVEIGINAFVDLINDLLAGRVGEDAVKPLLKYRPIARTILVTFDAASRKIVPVNAFEGRDSPGT